MEEAAKRSREAAEAAAVEERRRKEAEEAERLKKLLDEIVAGTDIRPETSPQLAVLITPVEAKQYQQQLAKLWPGGTLTLVKRDKGIEGGPQLISTYRLSKGSDALLLMFGLRADGQIADLGRMPNREYQ